MLMRYLFAVVLVLACFGCASTSSTGRSVAELKAIGTEKFGAGRFAIAIIPGSKGPVNEGTVSGLSTVFGPSSLVRDTAARLKEAHARRLAVLFDGRTPAKTQKVIQQSLAILPGKSLSGMQIYAIGVDPVKLEDAVQRVGARLVK